MKVSCPLTDFGIPQDIIDAAKKLGADTEQDAKDLATLVVNHSKGAIGDALKWVLGLLGKNP